MLDKVTFEPLKGRRYRVRKNGEFVIRDGRPLIVNEASIAATRSGLLNAGRKPPPPLQPVKRAVPEGRNAEGDYSTMWDNTFFTCPWCRDDNFRHGKTSGPTRCDSCHQPITVIPGPRWADRRTSFDNIGIDPDW